MVRREPRWTLLDWTPLVMAIAVVVITLLAR